ncbi:MAG: winged helix-turn-helix domain-containing protein [Desulfuromonadales bacterium]|uniref:winged helix-turn-helix domain-containing protein n=1 Tax=unclassified Desulfuromonas TaxID=2614637 RepID=UPI000325AEF3|nr:MULTISPECIES: response regulator transcription factor [unclassified Desulfuromonas]MCP3176221.1 response regulator transcription factor [Desulfuromonas sp. KJ2020]BCA78250.1 DNA-binding response regulator [Desulfuromonas sp. AOP6]
MRVLLIEDDDRTADFVAKGYQQAGYAVDRAANGVDGLFMASHTPYDIAVIDIMLPRLDGLTVIEKLREQKLRLPIIVVSAKKSVDDRILGLQSGSDDYLVKPFAFSELLARTQALLRRVNQIAEPMTLQVDDLSMDVARRKVFRAGREIDLQHREFALLEYLMRNAGRVVSKAMIMEHVWDYNFDPETNVVESRICRLRDKIDRPFSRQLIHTVRGVGYLLEARG